MILLFVKTFIKEDGSRYIHFESVTVLKEGKEVAISSREVVVSNQEKETPRIKRLLKEGNLAYIKKEATLPSESTASTQGDQVTLPGGASSNNKDNTSEGENQISEQENVFDVESKVAEWSQKLGVPAKVYHSVDEIPNAQARAAINAL